MTVKVISPGPVVTKRTTCPNCAYELEFTGEDVHLRVDYDGDSIRWIYCPRETCKSHYGIKGPTEIFVKWP